MYCNLGGLKELQTCAPLLDSVFVLIENEHCTKLTLCFTRWRFFNTYSEQSDDTTKFETCN